MTARRILLGLLLPIVLLLAQQAATAHEFQHLAHSAGATASVADPLPGEPALPGAAACEKCVAFAGLASAIASAVLVVLAAGLVSDTSRCPPPGVRAARVPPARGRSPPLPA